MDKNKIEELVAKYNEGLADPAEILALEQLLEEGSVELTQLRQLKNVERMISGCRFRADSRAMNAARRI